MDDCTTKTCLKCKLDLPLGNFCKDKNRKDGLNPICRMCSALYRVEYYQRNKEQLIQDVLDWKKNNPDKVKASNDKHREENNAIRRIDVPRKNVANRKRRDRYAIDAEYRKRISDQGKVYKDKYKDKIRERNKIKNLLNPYPNRRRVKKWRDENKDKVKTRSHTHDLNRRAREKKLPNSFTQEEWRQCLEYWDNKCAVCGKSPDFWTNLAADHWIALSDTKINNPGTVTTNIVPLCHARKDGENTCNTSKHNNDPIWWVMNKHGKRKGQKIINAINQYFEWVRNKNGVS